MNKQIIIDQLAENLGYIHSIVTTLQNKKELSNDAITAESELTVLAMHCECYIERCFEILHKLND
jgi:hypothetical protein